MWWSQRREERAFRRSIRGDIPEPSAALVNSIEQRLRAGSWRRTVGLRTVLAAGLTAALAGAFAVAGGAGYASSAVAKVGSGAKAAATGDGKGQANDPKGRKQPAAASQDARSASDDQYGPDRTTICHRTPSGTERTLVLPTAAARSHLREHRGSRGAGPDSEGACGSS